MDLCLINPFANQYVADAITIRTMLEAAIYTAIHGPDNGLGSHIENHLDVSKDFKAWVSAMPRKRPNSLKTYQKKYADRKDDQVNNDILLDGKTLSVGQKLVHGGLWTGTNGHMITTRPLSTTFNPIVAHQNALHRGKAYAAGRIDLIVLTVTTPNIKSFVFGPRGDMSHEYEVLLPAGVTLTRTNEKLWNANATIRDAHFNKKDVPVYVVEVDVSYVEHQDYPLEDGA